MFALVADGKNGLRVIQMISPENVPESMGFSPRPNPKLIAMFPTRGPAVAVSRGLDRDRVVDETGNQTVVFGRRGSRPFQSGEMEAFYRHYAGSYPTNHLTRQTGELYQVEDVFVRDGRLMTGGGSELPHGQEFNAIPEKSETRLPLGRLIRRGQ